MIFLQKIFYFSQHTGLWVVPGYLYMAPGYPGEMCEGCWVVVRRETERVFTHLASPTTNPGRRPSSDLTAPPALSQYLTPKGKWIGITSSKITTK